MDNKKIVILAIIALIVAAILFWWFKPEAAAPEIDTLLPDGTPMENFNPDDAATNVLPPTENSILVSAQIAGEFVTIDNLYLEQPAFVVIYEADGTQLGRLVGNSGLVSAGQSQDLEINASITAGRNYFAALHKDNGDRTFNAAADEALLDSAGEPIKVLFQVAN